MRSRYIDREIIAALLARMEPRAQEILCLMLQAGVRVGDAVAARGSDFILSDKKEHLFVFVAQKTGKPGAAVISPELHAALRARPGYCWPSWGKSGHITRQSAWNYIKRACKAAGIDPGGISPHSARKAAAVAARKAGGFAAAQEAMQHTGRDITALYAFSDRFADPDEPIRWRDIDILRGYLRNGG